MRLDSISEAIVGRNVVAVYVSDGHLVLDTDRGQVAYRVEGDCCSRSYFHDVVGTAKLLDNGPVAAVEEIELQPGDPGYHDSGCAPSTYDRGQWVRSACGVDHEWLEVYGYRFVTEHAVWGEQSTVVAFRNDSNGYYGGWMEPCEAPDLSDLQRITMDWDAGDAA